MGLYLAIYRDLLTISVLFEWFPSGWSANSFEKWRQRRARRAAAADQNIRVTKNEERRCYLNSPPIQVTKLKKYISVRGRRTRPCRDTSSASVLYSSFQNLSGASRKVLCASQNIKIMPISRRSLSDGNMPSKLGDNGKNRLGNPAGLRPLGFPSQFLPLFPSFFGNI